MKQFLLLKILFICSSLQSMTSQPEFTLPIQRTKGDYIIHCCIEENLVGRIIYSIHGDEGFITWIVVHSTYQRQGIGSTLLTKSMEHMKQQQCLQTKLNVSSTNTDLQTFYTKRGFLLEPSHNINSSWYLYKKDL